MHNSMQEFVGSNPTGRTDFSIIFVSTFLPLLLSPDYTLFTILSVVRSGEMRGIIWGNQPLYAYIIHAYSALSWRF